MIFKGSLDLIPSPSAKIQIMGGKFCLRYKCKTLLSVVNITDKVPLYQDWRSLIGRDYSVVPDSIFIFF